MIKFDTFKKRANVPMCKHLHLMVNLVNDLKITGHILIDEQHVQVVVRSLPKSWERMKVQMTYNETLSLSMTMLITWN